MEMNRGEQSQQGQSTHTFYPFLILNGTGHSQASAAGCSQPWHFSVRMLAGAPS